MVSVIPAQSAAHSQLGAGLAPEDNARMEEALEFVRPLYEGKTVGCGQDALQFAQVVAGILVQLKADAPTRIAALLFELPTINPKAAESIADTFGQEVAELVAGVRQLIRLRDMTFGQSDVGRARNAPQLAAAQVETLRKMLLAMASDMRMVLVRLASRVAVLRYFAEHKLENERTERYARETFDLYTPLANRLGVWQLKWELEDLSFRFLEPQSYKRIARMLEEKRIERESFVNHAIERLKSELAAAGIKAEVSGRPKHIYSIWSKMRGKSLDFSELYDVRAFRVIVDDVKACYTVLGIVHNIWTPIESEFDDYIARPKPNGYRSLHTVVKAEDGRPLEVQVRTQEMHRFAEFGVAAHWRYKESGSVPSSHKYDEKIAWLRQLLAWKSEVVDAVVGQEEIRREWVEKLKSASLDDRIYVLTPQARIIELPSGATPIDFAYHLHSDVGHRCRGARVDGAMVPLNTPLKNGQTVEIITAKGEQAAAGAAGPSRDWLSPGYVASPRTRSKIRAWFNAIEQQETLANGRTLIEKSLQRLGKTAINLEELAHRLGFSRLDDLLLSIGRDTFSLRHVEQALQAEEPNRLLQKAPNPDDAVVARRSRAVQGAKPGVLVLGTEGLLTQLAKCCKPAPPDLIVGFITRGKGVSIHRANCKNFAEMQAKAPERVIHTEWGASEQGVVYPVDIFVLARDRQGLLRDISEILLREKINVVGVNTQSVKGQARMQFTAEIDSTGQLHKALSIIRNVPGVEEARRQ